MSMGQNYGEVNGIQFKQAKYLKPLKEKYCQWVCRGLVGGRQCQRVPN